MLNTVNLDWKTGLSKFPQENWTHFVYNLESERMKTKEYE